MMSSAQLKILAAGCAHLFARACLGANAEAGGSHPPPLRRYGPLRAAAAASCRQRLLLVYSWLPESANVLVYGFQAVRGFFRSGTSCRWFLSIQTTQQSTSAAQRGRCRRQCRSIHNTRTSGHQRHGGNAWGVCAASVSRFCRCTRCGGHRRHGGTESAAAGAAAVHLDSTTAAGAQRRESAPSLSGDGAARAMAPSSGEDGSGRSEY